MEIQTRLALLDQHLSLLIESTENCDRLTGESIASTLFFIQEQIHLIQDGLKTDAEQPKQTQERPHRMTTVGRYRFLCQQLEIEDGIRVENGIHRCNYHVDDLEQRYAQLLQTKAIDAFHQATNSVAQTDTLSNTVEKSDENIGLKLFDSRKS